MYVLLCHSPEDTCVCTSAGLWTTVVLILHVLFFFHPTQAPPLLYIHLSPIHHFTCLSNLPFIFSPAFNPLHSHHFLLLCADLSKIFYVTHTTLLHSLSKSSLRFCRRYIKSQRRTSSTAIFKPLHYSHEGSAQACGS